MSVLIKGMKMPTSCRRCDFSQPDGCGFFCTITVGKPIIDSLTHSRHARCPLVPVPEPHGRLGDLDELFRTMENKGWFDNADRDIAEDIVLNAATIIPANEEE